MIDSIHTGMPTYLFILNKYGCILQIFYQWCAIPLSTETKYPFMEQASLGARRDYADPCYTIPVHVPVVNQTVRV